MALIVPVRGFTPQIGKDCFLAENATIVGDTVIGDGCSIWFNAVLRGDVNWIKIGNHVNIQDGSVLHTLYEKSTITIGDYVQIKLLGLLIEVNIIFTLEICMKVKSSRV